MKKLIYLATLAITFPFIASAQHKLTIGSWRATIKTSTGVEIPFNFEVTQTPGKQQIAIINGTEHFKVSDVRVSGDSVFIHMPLFDSEFKAKFVGNAVTGNWIKHLPTRDVLMAFAAQPNQKARFTQPAAPLFNIQGRWGAIFASGDTTVAEFKQLGAKLTGTFLTTTGDYRYLEGKVAGDSLYLSCFDGGHAFLFTARIKDARTITGGKFYSGYAGTDKWDAVKNAKAKLPDAYSLTTMKPDAKKVTFTFTDLDGNKVSLNDVRYKNKVVILQMMGSWCPNCMDETAYLVNFYKKYNPKGVEIIGLAYERSTDYTRSKNSLSLLKKRFNVPYNILVTGYTNDKKEAAKSLPALANFMAFPTTLIVDKKGDVRKIHTGFSGPGTGKYYSEFTKEFEKLMDNLLAE